MPLLSHLFNATFRNTKVFTCASNANNLECVRYASKKAGSSTRIKPGHPRPKHRGWKVQDGEFVQAGTLLVTQLHPRFHPGLHVGMGRNGTLYALEPGTVMVTCERIELDMDRDFIRKHYGERGDFIYKKHFNIIPKPQHDRFVLIDRI